MGSKVTGLMPWKWVLPPGRDPPPTPTRLCTGTSTGFCSGPPPALSPRDDGGGAPRREAPESWDDCHCGSSQDPADRFNLSRERYLTKNWGQPRSALQAQVPGGL